MKAKSKQGKSKVSKQAQKVSLEEAQARLMEEEQKKQEQCAKEINAVLEKYGYGMQFSVIPKLISK